MNRFFRSKAATWGVVLLGLLVGLGLFGPLLVPYPDAADHWRDIGFWQDSPTAAPPVWTAGPWDRVPQSPSRRVEATSPPLVETLNGVQKVTWTLEFPPAAKGTLIVPGTGPVPLLVSVQAADGTWVERDKRRLEASAGQPGRFAISLEGSSALQVTELLADGAPAEAPSLILAGQVAGVLGTDAAKRDVFTGIVLGVRWALILGLLVSFLTVGLGLGLGILAACSGGWVDSLINRIYEFFSLMPLMPFLIVLSTVYRPSLWTFFLLGLLFFWTKAFKPVYAMALQIRNEVYLEAGRSLGASRWRLATRYILPALLPYGFAVMALSVPGIILYEASISLLGLGDATTVTWGQMLHDAFAQGAVINRLWWWVLPPGLMIALTGLTFALLGRGFDQVWQAQSPKRLLTGRGSSPEPI